MTKTGPFAPGLLARLPRAPRKVVLVRASRIGDFLCAIPALRALRKALPEAEISMVTLPMLQALAERSPHIDRYFPFPGYPGLAEQFFEPHKALQFFSRMQAEEFDLAIQLQGSGVNSNPFTMMLGARATAGFVRDEDTPGKLDAALPLPTGGHEIERVLALVEFLGAPRHGTQLEFPLRPEDRQGANALLDGLPRPLVGIHAASRNRTRRWPVERFAQAGRLLRQKTGGTIVLLGDAAEREAASWLAQQVGGSCANLAGWTTLPVLGAVIERLNMLVTNDSGPAHIAYALRTPTVTVFGGGEPLHNGPFPPKAVQSGSSGREFQWRGPFRTLLYPVDCRPCTYTECPIGYVCLNHVSVDQVVESALELLFEQAQAGNAAI